MSFDDRQTKRIPLPPDPVEQEAFDIWKASYEALVERGEQRGWLRTDMDGAQYIGDPRPSGYEQHLETDEEYAARLRSPLARISYEMAEAALRQAKMSVEKLAFIDAVHLEPGHYVTFEVHQERKSE